MPANHLAPISGSSIKTTSKQRATEDIASSSAKGDDNNQSQQ